MKWQKDLLKQEINWNCPKTNNKNTKAYHKYCRDHFPLLVNNAHPDLYMLNYLSLTFLSLIDHGQRRFHDNSRSYCQYWFRSYNNHCSFHGISSMYDMLVRLVIAMACGGTNDQPMISFHESAGYYQAI